MRIRPILLSAAALTALSSVAIAQTRTGEAAMGDWRADAPGVVRLLTVKDVPPTSASSAVPSALAPRPTGAELHTLPGFSVASFAKVLGARQIRVAPNGDIFIAQTNVGTVTVLHASDGAAAPDSQTVFAKGLKLPFGMAFYPPGPHPKWIYVAENNRVIRYPYENGDTVGRGAPEVIVDKLSSTTGGHFTRDIDFSKDGKTLYVSIGSGSNVAQEMPGKTVEEAKAWDAEVRATGATWGPEGNRADILKFTPEGQKATLVATGVRNCVSIRVNPVTDTPWCVVNERDNLGDDLPFDYMTHLKTGGFYGWPWYYLGGHVDNRPKSARPDLADKITVPDVMFQAHSAALGLTFYNAKSGPALFPAAFQGDAFVTLHGSWNRKLRTGYKLVRVKMRNGAAVGTYEDVLTGFVIDDKSVWGRPVGVAVAHDGALLVTDDGGGMIWRIAPSQTPPKTATVAKADPVSASASGNTP